MNRPDYSDPVAVMKWLDVQEDGIQRYLNREGVTIGDELEMEWCVAPVVSIWSLHNPEAPAKLWIISGDLPTDFIGAPGITDARQATKAICDRWLDVAGHLSRGVQHPSIVIGHTDRPEEFPKLGDLLRKRATLLKSWTENDEKWARGC